MNNLPSFAVECYELFNRSRNENCVLIPGETTFLLSGYASVEIREQGSNLIFQFIYAGCKQRFSAFAENSSTHDVVAFLIGARNISKIRKALLAPKFNFTEIARMFFTFPGGHIWYQYERGLENIPGNHFCWNIEFENQTTKYSNFYDAELLLRRIAKNRG